jgi:transcriptional regulator with XRE-family HTH domain
MTGRVRGRLNTIGQAVGRLRYERGWTQDLLAARLQCQGADVSRQMLANIESGRTQVTDEHILAFQKVFRVPIVMLFPKSDQELDERFASDEKTRRLKVPGQPKR